MDTPIAEEEFRRYAQSQADRGWHLIGLHRRDGSGCCRHCGRTHPCDERVYGGRLIVHYENWFGDQPPRLLRPYLRG
ncbi:hypothetical protein QEZ54_14835 [Catellatospora sp. KI3]|uniref:hypothetical protein n=1 Tax=Catellatospora sp. KI3 TaxID=3041620 RepID=UPI00248217BA|nr:hypothetical protein [Catellatospora sp. KI3]MDI1462243.1 hypothetical protein [Catellatospora sp. KI3]